MKRVTVTASADDWRAILVALPRCGLCSARAAVTLDGHLRCVVCLPRPCLGRLESAAWAVAAEAVEAALSPHEPEGAWSTDVQSLSR
jgi:hypothetical protein